MVYVYCFSPHAVLRYVVDMVTFAAEFSVVSAHFLTKIESE